MLPYAFSFFEMHVSPLVRDEILSGDPLFPRRRFGYSEWYRVLEGCGLLPLSEPASPLPLYGRGESEAVAVAREMRWRLLINDYRPLEFAGASGIRTLSIPAFILALYESGTISRESAEQKLSLIEEVTSDRILDPVLTRIRRTGRQ